MRFQPLPYGKLLGTLSWYCSNLAEKMTFLISVIFGDNIPVYSLLSGESTVPFHVILTMVPTMTVEYSVEESALEVEA